MSQKKIKRLIFLSLGVLVLIIAYILVSVSADRKISNSDGTDGLESSIILSVSADQIASLSFGQSDHLTVFEQKNNNWFVTEDPAFQMNEGKIKLLTNDLAELRVVRTIQNPGDLSQYGINEDSKRIIVNLSDGRSESIIIGDRNSTTNQLYFIMNNDTDNVYVTETAIDQHFSGDEKAFAKYEEFPEITPMQIKEIQVIRADDEYLIKMPGDSNCSVTDKNGETQLADVNVLGVIQNNISNISWADNLEYDCKDNSLYGLDPVQCSVSITYEIDNEQITVSLLIGDQVNGRYYVQMQGSKEVHSIRSEYISALVEGKASDFWNLSYSFVSISDLESMEVVNEGNTYLLSFENADSATDSKWFVDSKEVEKAFFTDFYYSCVSVTAQERLTAVPDITEDPVLRLIYHLKDGTEKEISYYKENQNFYTVIYEDGNKAAHTNKLYVNTMLEKLKVLLSQI